MILIFELDAQSDLDMDFKVSFKPNSSFFVPKMSEPLWCIECFNYLVLCIFLYFMICQIACFSLLFPKKNKLLTIDRSFKIWLFILSNYYLVKKKLILKVWGNEYFQRETAYFDDAYKLVVFLLTLNSPT